MTQGGRIGKRFAQAKARLQALRNREATKQRKLEARRKVILGGALMVYLGGAILAGLIATAMPVAILG